ncbi:MAG: polyketide synthase dehydratase domain-containing protein [Deltaproteobacteria bacterium]|nr:polyketide synthase dehydratase domain-containing protein [Deltaproteobacteria bacterium]
MEDLPRVIESARLPLDIPIRLYLNDHCVDGHAVLPAVEAMAMLAQAVKRFRPGTDVTAMTALQFEKFLYLAPEADRVAAFCDISVYENGDVKAVLTTRTQSKKAALARVKAHAALIFPQQEPPIPNLALDLAASLEGVCFSVQAEKIYPDLIPFGPSYRNVAILHVAGQSAIAEIRAPVVATSAESSHQLGSPFVLDAAMHAACVWGQRFAGVVAFPVAMDRCRVYAPTRAGETYFAHVIHVRTDSGLLIFDLRIYDRDGCLYVACSGVRMKDVSGGKNSPPRWIGISEADQTTDRMAAGCDAFAVIESKTVAPFADKVLSADERKRFENMGDRRRKSYLAARLACKRLSRILSGNDTQTDPRAITTVYADRPRPCCPLTDGRSAYLCSVSHDDRFAVAVASTGRVGVDVEKISERVLKSRSLYMSGQEQALARESRLGEIEAAVRIWSIKEAVTKALDISLTDAWNRVQVRSVGSSESRFQIDDQDPCSAVHDAVGQHVFTLVCRL